MAPSGDMVGPVYPGVEAANQVMEINFEIFLSENLSITVLIFVFIQFSIVGERVRGETVMAGPKLPNVEEKNQVGDFPLKNQTKK